MELVVTLPAEVFRCRICFVTKAAGRPTFGEYKDHSALLRHYRRLHDPETVPVFECQFCGRRDPRLKTLRLHQRLCNADSATPGAASRGRVSMGHDAVSGSLGHPERSAGGRSQARAPEVSRTGPSSLVSAGRKPQVKAAREVSTTGRLTLGNREGLWPQPSPVPEASRTDRLDLGLTYAAVLTRSSVVGSQAVLPSPCVSVQASVTPRTAVVATPASCVLCVRTPRRSGIPMPIRSATSTASPRVPSASSGGEGSVLPTPVAERVVPARGAVSGKGSGTPLPASATAPRGVRWPRRAANAGASRPPSVVSVGTGLGLPPAFATPPTGGSAMRVDSGRQAASLAATGGVVIHGAPAPLADAPKAARSADAPDGVVLVRSQTYTRRVPSALPAAASSDARHSASTQAGSVATKKASVADNEWHIVTPRRDRRRAAGRRPPPPDRRRIIPPSPQSNGPARASAPGRPARATPRVSRAGGRARATAGPSVGGAANNSRGAPGPSARPARATPGDARPAQATPATPATAAPSGSNRRAPSPRNDGPERAGAPGRPARAAPRASRAGGGPLATAGPSVGGAANNSRGAPDSSAGAATESSTAPPPTQTTEQRDVSGGTADASPTTGSKKRRRRRRNNRPSPNLPPQNSRPTPTSTNPPVPSEQGATEAAPPPPPPADSRLTERQRRWLTALESVHSQPWDAFVAVVEDFVSEIAQTKPQRQAAGDRQDGPPAAAHRGQGRADAAANPPPPAPTRGRGGRRGGRGARRAAAAERRCTSCCPGLCRHHAS
ncbi:mucin-1-like [Schistocerca cancellata]|uniref:mucin-1-like n=1 Tax=Schistocerca cancellata TaxID=274614 RepID=UPI002119166A|nr:mucin-1-like [Schistocerca cancellata]